MTIAFDIETCPQPQDHLSEIRLRRLGIEADRLARLTPDAPREEMERKAASLHPALGWVCCVSVCYHFGPSVPERQAAYTGALAAGLTYSDFERQLRSEPYITHSFIAPTPDHEHDLLKEFWVWARAVRTEVRQPFTWVGFNSKRFDAPFLKVRSLRNGVRLPDPWLDMAESRPWVTTGHRDLMAEVPAGFGLADLCDVLGVDSPKGDLHGGGVADAVARGELARVATYCEGDARAVLECLHTLQGLGGLTPATR